MAKQLELLDDSLACDDDADSAMAVTRKAIESLLAGMYHDAPSMYHDGASMARVIDFLFTQYLLYFKSEQSIEWYDFAVTWGAFTTLPAKESYEFARSSL